MRGLHGSPNPTRDRARKYSLGVNFDLRFMDMAAFGAPQGPMLKAGTRRDSALDRHAGLASRTARTLGGARRRRLQIGHGIDPGSIVRQRTFVCQHLAEVAVLNPRAAQLAPIAVHRAFARIVGHRSRASLRRPQCVSFRDGSNTRSTWRFNALRTPMRANIGGPSCSATSNNGCIAACHSSASYPAFGSLVMYWAASCNVRSGCFRPGNMIGSKLLVP